MIGNKFKKSCKTYSIISATYTKYIDVYCMCVSLLFLNIEYWPWLCVQHVLYCILFECIFEVCISISDTIQVHFSGRIIKSDTCFTQQYAPYLSLGFVCVCFSIGTLYSHRPCLSFYTRVFVCAYVSMHFIPFSIRTLFMQPENECNKYQKRNRSKRVHMILFVLK